MPSLVERLAPPGVEVETSGTFDEAAVRLGRDPPQAVIVNLTPSDLPWAELQTLCRAGSPPIPVLYESCVHSRPQEAGIAELGDCDAFLAKPYSVEQLAMEIERLVIRARGSARTARSGSGEKPAVEAGDCAKTRSFAPRRIRDRR